jgi:hypothetical protein
MKDEAISNDENSNGHTDFSGSTGELESPDRFMRQQPASRTSTGTLTQKGPYVNLPTTSGQTDLTWPAALKSSTDTSFERAEKGIMDLDISKRFDDQLEYRILVQFSNFLFDRIRGIETLKGVQYGLRVYPFHSLEDDKLSLVRIELRVPGIVGNEHRDLWVDYSRILGKAMNDFLNEIRPTSKEGRAFRRIMNNLSEGIGTF